MTATAPPLAPSPEAPQAPSAPDAGSLRGWVTFGLTSGVAVASAIAIFLPGLDRTAVGGAAIVMMVAMLFLRFPAAICMIVPSLMAMYALRGWRLVESSAETLPYDSIAKWSLSVLPMFIMLGLLMWRSGMTGSVYDAAKHWLGWMPGGLAVGTNLAGTGLATVSGSSTGVVYALGRVGLPEMLKAGYDKRLALGSIIVASLPGQLIPPSILLVLYAGIAEVPVGQQLLAGIAPGILVGLAFSVMLLALAVFGRMAGQDSPQGQPVETSWRMRWLTLTRVWPVPLLAVIIVAGMFSGVVTATEAGALAALCAILLTFVWRGGEGGFKGSVNAIRQASLGAVAGVGGIFFLLVGVEMLSRMMTLSGISEGLTDLIAEWELSRVEFLLVMMVVYLVLGAFMEPLPMMVLTVPVLMPTLAALDISLLWFGIFVVFMGELAVLSPPIGILAMVIHTIAKDPQVNQGQEISLKDVFVASLWFLPMAIVVVLVLIAWPDLATFLPELSSAK